MKIRPSPLWITSRRLMPVASRWEFFDFWTPWNITRSDFSKVIYIVMLRGHHTAGGTASIPGGSHWGLRTADAGGRAARGYFQILFCNLEQKKIPTHYNPPSLRPEFEKPTVWGKNMHFQNVKSWLRNNLDLLLRRLVVPPVCIRPSVSMGMGID